MFVSINTGADALIDGAEKITASDLGVRFSGFRTLDRFLEQIKDLHVGLISWPGGTLAEERVDSFGLEFDDLTSADSKMPSLSEMMEVARDQGAELSVVLPTVRYSGRIDEMRADVQNFMHDLLSGEYGDLPDRLIFHIGSEHYHHFQGLSPDGAASEYGRVASAMVEELTHALNDPSINVIGADIDLSVQAGRTMAEDEDIRDSFSPESLANVDLVMHHRYAARAEGIDFNLKPFSAILDTWQQDVTEAGGDTPQIHLSEWNVASVTRNEGVSSYIREMASQGISVRRSDIDLEGRTTTEFENFWQELLSTRDYGVAVPKLYLEMFSEYQAEGLGAASIHAADLMHAGRITYTDTEGNPVQYVGAEMIKMIYESVEGTQVLDVSTENTRASDLWTYAYEGDDRVVVFLASDDDAVVGEVTVEVEGLQGGYAAVWTDSLTAEVPADWMTRFGVPDNANVDESNEGQTYALGVRGDVATQVIGDQVTVTLTEPGQVVRIIVAHSQAEADLIAQWAGEPDFETTISGDVAEVVLEDPIASSAFLLPIKGITDDQGRIAELLRTLSPNTNNASAFLDAGAPQAPLTTPQLLAYPSSAPAPAPAHVDATFASSTGNANQENTEIQTEGPTEGLAEEAASTPQDEGPAQTATETAPGDDSLHAAPHGADDGNTQDMEGLPPLLPYEDDSSTDAPENGSAEPASLVAEISTMAGSAFGAGLMGILAAMAGIGG